MDSIKDRTHRKEGVVKEPVQEVDQHDGKENVSCKVHDLHSKEEETKVEKALKSFVITLVLMEGVMLVVVDSHYQDSEREYGRKNRQEQAVE